MKNKTNKSKTKKVAILGLLGALALTISFCESLLMPNANFLPPGAKPGLSNIITLLASSVFGAGSGFYVVAVKAAFALITRGATAFFMSFAGGVLSLLAMIFALKFGKDKISFVGIGIIGAIFHNLGQLTVSVIMTGTNAMLYYAPILLAFSLITGFVTGTIVKTVLPPVKRAMENQLSIK